MVRSRVIVVSAVLALGLLAGCDQDAEPGIAGGGGTRASDEPAPDVSTPTTDSTAPTAKPPTTPEQAAPEPVVPQPDLSVPVDRDPSLGANPAFLVDGAGIAVTRCDLPPWSLQPAAARAYYRAAIRCHHASWKRALARFGMHLDLPALWAGSRASRYHGGCGSNTTGREAFYCSVDETIVMPFDSMYSLASYGEGNALAVLSHEFGHHLQQEMGIVDGYALRRDAAGWDTPAGFLLSRQFELQAWCLSGMFYGVNTGRGDITSYLSERAYDNNSGAGDRPGEDREHGTNANIGGWFSWGLHPSMDASDGAQPEIYECNPWAARDPSTLN